MENYKLNAFTQLLSDISREEYDTIRITLESVYEVGLEKTMFAILNAVVINEEDEEQFSPRVEPNTTDPVKIATNSVEEKEVADTTDQVTPSASTLPEVNLKE